MRAAIAFASLALIGLVAGCAHSTTHELESPASLPASPPSRSCSIGVGRFVDDQGVDFALDLRDYLREHGPCTHVFAVSDEANEKADIVVSGSVTPEYDWMSSGRTPETRGGQTWALMAIFPATAGFTMLAIGETQSGAQGVKKAAYFTLLGTAALEALGIGLIVDNGGRVQLIGKVTAEVDIRRPGAPPDHLKLDDEFKIRDRAPSTAQNDAEKFGAMQRGGLERVFEHIAARLDQVASLPPPPAPAPAAR